MRDQRFYDMTLSLIDQGESTHALHLLFGKMIGAIQQPESWRDVCADFRSHPVHSALMQDPCTARAFDKPRGYAGDAELIDLFYDQKAPEGTSALGEQIFGITTNDIPARALRFRRDYAEQRLTKAWEEGKQICVLACGHLREADGLIGKDLTNITVIDQDPESLAVIERNHNGRINKVEANVLHYLRRAAKEGSQFDLIYTLGLTDYFDERAMSLLYRMMDGCLSPQGEMMVANFLPSHAGQSWMEASMDWILVNRTEEDMERHADEVGLQARTFRDPSESVVIAEMTAH